MTFPGVVPQFVYPNGSAVTFQVVDYSYLEYNSDLKICTKTTPDVFDIWFNQENSDNEAYLSPSTQFVIKYPVINLEDFACSYGCIMQ